MSVLRPLPDQPSLEYDRKQAKRLLRQMRRGDARAFERARAQHPGLSASPEKLVLADAQLVVAREYGFASWPRLVQYYGDVERDRHNAQEWREPGQYEREVEWLMREHTETRGWAGRKLAAYVPRFYGMHIEEVYASAITVDDARLAVARSHSAPSWGVLVAREPDGERKVFRDEPWEVTPAQRAAHAMQRYDLETLKQVVEENPGLIDQTNAGKIARGFSLFASCFALERKNGREAMRPIREYLASLGGDPQYHMNLLLLGHLHMNADEVRALIEQGADPDWITPAGVPLLELALITYWDGDAIDVLRPHVTPRKALFIAAGLGDLRGVASFLDRDGRPTDAARKLRPYFGLTPLRMPQLPNPKDDEILMEAFLIALFNGRTNVMEYLASRGFDVNSRIWDAPLVQLAVGNNWYAAAECLVKLGADLDLPGSSNGSARDMARMWLLNGNMELAKSRRLATLCGLNADAILAEHEASLPSTRPLDARAQLLIELASDDAARRGAAAVGLENLLFGILRTKTVALTFFTQVSGMDREQFYANIAERVRFRDECIDHPMLPLGPDVVAVIDDARRIAREARCKAVTPAHLLRALIADDDGFAAGLLAEYGASASMLREQMHNTN